MQQPSRTPSDILKPIDWLTGKWATTQGIGEYPTIKPFTYNDTIEFTFIGQPMLNYSSSAINPATGMPMKQERGFLRIKPGTFEVTFIVSHNFGLNTIEEGISNVEKKVITLKTTSITRSSLSKPPHVLGFQRQFKLIEPDTLEVILSMQTENTPMTQHLRAVYKKV